MRGERLMGRPSARAPLPAGAFCRRSGAHGQPPWAGHAIAALERGAWRCGASMWVLMIVLASCQDVAEQPGPIEAVTFDPGYPSLHTVPPRPQLSYTVEQRRAIVDMLIADRANARYTEEVVRYRAGLSSEPPPAAPALAAVSPDLEATRPTPRTRSRLRTRHALRPPSFPRPNSRTRATVSIRSCGIWSTAVPGRKVLLQPVNLMRMPRAPAPPEMIARAAAYPPHSKVVVLAMPPDPASLPAPRPAPPLASTEAQDLASLGAPVQVLTTAAIGRSDPGRPGAGSGLGHARHGGWPGRRAASHAG